MIFTLKLICFFLILQNTTDYVITATLIREEKETNEDGVGLLAYLTPISCLGIAVVCTFFLFYPWR